VGGNKKRRGERQALVRESDIKNGSVLVKGARVAAANRSNLNQKLGESIIAAHQKLFSCCEEKKKKNSLKAEETWGGENGEGESTNRS